MFNGNINNAHTVLHIQKSVGRACNREKKLEAREINSF